MNELTEAQKQWLQDNAARIWEVFVYLSDSPDDIRGSTCGCCEGKRQLLAEFEGLAKAAA